MNFDAFEAMYKMLWEMLYKIFAILGVDLKDPNAKEEAAQ